MTIFGFKKKSSKISLYAFFFTFFFVLMFFNVTFLEKKNCDTFNGNDLDEKQISRVNVVNNPVSSSFELYGMPLKVIQHSKVTNTIYPLSLPTNISFTLAEDWISDNISILFDGVAEENDIITNGDFFSNSNDWSYSSNNPSEIIDKEWDSNGNPGGCVYVEIHNGQMYANDYGYYEQIISSTDIFVSGYVATLSIDYKYEPKGGTPSDDIDAYMAVEIGGIEKNKSVKFSDLTQDSWSNLYMVYEPLSLGQVIPNDISIRIGVIVENDIIPSTSQQLWIDNVEFNIWTGINQSNILIATDNENEINYQYNNITSGQGISIINNEHIRNETSDVVFTISKNSTYTEELSVKNITITSNLSKYMNSTVGGLASSSYEINENITWHTEFSITTPYDYLENWITIEKPDNWFIFSVKDGYDSEKIESCLGTGIGTYEMTIPIGLIDNGLWKIEANSSNYLNNGEICVWNESEFVKENKLILDDLYNLNVTINNTVSLNDTVINCTIKYPNGTILWEDSKEPIAYNVNFGNLFVGSNMTVGKYDVEVFWSNNLSYSNRYQVGFVRFEFFIWHHTNLSAIDSYSELSAGSPFLIKVEFLDVDFNEIIGFADISYNSTFDTEGIMSYQGSGIYFAEIDINPLDLGDYYFSFNSSKTYYENISKNNLIHLKIISQALALEVPRTTLQSYGNNFVICQVNVTGAISGALLWPANVSSDWEYGYSNVSHNNGTFSFNFSTAGLPLYGTLEAYTIKIMANKSDYGEIFDFVSLTIFPISTVATSNQTFISTNIDQIVSVSINYTEEGTGVLIANPLCNIIWEGNSNYSYDSGRILINLYTQDLTISDYTVIIRISKPGFANAFLSISVLIIEKSVNIELYHNEVEIEQNTQLNGLLYDIMEFSCKIYSPSDHQYVASDKVELIGDSYGADVTYSGDNWFNFSIEITDNDFPLGINYFYIEFQDENYTTTTFSFQIMVNQRNFNISKLNFNDIIECYPGETISLRIKLTDENSSSYIENASISYSWEYGWGTFNYTGNGIYEAELSILQNIKGNHKITLIFYKEGLIYKTQDYSYYINLIEEGFPMYILWILIGVLTPVFTISSILIIRSYVIIPKRRKIERELVARTQPFKDTMNIQAIIGIHRGSGISIFSRTYSILREDDIIGFSGFIQAISLMGYQYVEHRKFEANYITEEGKDLIRELDFNLFHALICDYNELRFVLILSSKASNRLRKQLRAMTEEMYVKNETIVKNFVGVLPPFEQLFPPIIKNYFNLNYKNKYKINPNAVFYQKFKHSGNLSALKIRIINNIESYSKFSEEFYLEVILNLISHKNEYEAIIALESLIHKNLIVPVNRYNDTEE